MCLNAEKDVRAPEPRTLSDAETKRQSVVCRRYWRCLYAVFLRQCSLTANLFCSTKLRGGDSGEAIAYGGGRLPENFVRHVFNYAVSFISNQYIITAFSSQMSSYTHQKFSLGELGQQTSDWGRAP